MAYIKIKITALDDHGHFGSTSYYCSECGYDCENIKIKCPNCKVEFDEDPKTELNGYPFGSSDF